MVKKVLAVLGSLVVVAGVLYIFAQSFLNERNTPQPQGDKPAFTSEVREVLQKSKGFQLLVSYTNRGFEPAVATIKKGETVRFTNNSPENLWVVATKHRLYPRAEGGCGVSAFDSCKDIKHGEFWEFTFERSGVWPYQNKMDPGRSGNITVQ